MGAKSVFLLALYIIYYVSQKKVSLTGLEWHEGELMTSFSFLFELSL